MPSTSVNQNFRDYAIFVLNDHLFESILHYYIQNTIIPGPITVAVTMPA